jgi:hypothetical protein
MLSRVAAGVFGSLFVMSHSQFPRHMIYRLDFSLTEVTDEGLKRLRIALPECEIEQ